MQNDDGDIEIVQGLLEGEHVVTSAQFMLDSESKLREAIQKMLEPQAPSTEAHAHAGRDMDKQDEKMDDLFADDEKDKQGKESLEGLFEKDDSEKSKVKSEK